MASAHRTATDHLAVLEEMERFAEEFDFFQAVRHVERSFPEKPRIGTSTRLQDDPLRFSQEASLAFAPSTIAKFRPPTAYEPAELQVRFLGLFGPDGPLPLHLSEYARQRERHHNDPTFTRFLDVFHHRMLCLFYRAWAESQPAVHYARPQTDRFSCYVGSLFGMGWPELRNRDAWSDESKLFHAGQLANQSKNPANLAAILAEVFRVPVHIEEFVGEWTEIPPSCRTQITQHSSRAKLGQTATLGSHIWDCQQRFRVVLGPMTWNDYQRLMPGADGLEVFRAVVKNYLGDELLWELNLVLAQPETPSGQLNGSTSLGRSSWLSPHGHSCDARDLTLAAEAC